MSRVAHNRDVHGILGKIKQANLFSVRARLYQKLACVVRDGSDHSIDVDAANDLLSHFLLSDLTALSHQSSVASSELESILILAYYSLESLKGKASDKFGKLLAAFLSCHCDSVQPLVWMVQCCISYIRFQNSLLTSLKRQITELLSKFDSIDTNNFAASPVFFQDFLFVFTLLLRDDENAQTLAATIVKSFRFVFTKLSREEKTELLKSVDTEEFRNHIRTMCRSPRLHTVVSDILVVLVQRCGDVLHSASMANIILSWATYLAKSLIHDAALSFFLTWTELINNFACNKAVILSSRHRKLILSGFGPSLTNSKLRTPELMAAKIRTWWHFIVQVADADPRFFCNTENFLQVVAPLISVVTGDSVAFTATAGISFDTCLSSFNQSEFGKLVQSNQGNVQLDLLGVSCTILYSVLMSSLGTNSHDKFQKWLKNNHQIVSLNGSFGEALPKSAVLGLESTTLAPAICHVVSGLFGEVTKTFPSKQDDNMEIIAPESCASSISHLFSALLFWLASSIDCSQNSGMAHWKELLNLLNSFSKFPIDASTLAGLHVAFVCELPFTNSLENDQSDYVDLLSQIVDLVSKGVTSDPSSAIFCAETAVMKMLAWFRKLPSFCIARQFNWNAVESVFSIITRQKPSPPAYVIYCWVQHWQRLEEFVEEWLSSNPHFFDLPTFTTFLALPFKLLRLCPVANNSNCCHTIPAKSVDITGHDAVACRCSACRRLLDSEFLTNLAAKWRNLFETFCNMTGNDTPRLTRCNNSITKLCTKLLKNLKPNEPSKGSLSLPFLTFAALCFESIREKTFSTGCTRRTSRGLNSTCANTQSETSNIFIQCVAAASRESAESLVAIIVLAEHIHQQCKKSKFHMAHVTAPLGFAVTSICQSYISCFESISGNIRSNSINEFSTVAKSIIPSVIALLSSSVKVAEAFKTGVCCIGPDETVGISTSSVCDMVIKGTNTILSSLNLFGDTKTALLSSSSFHEKAEGDNNESLEYSFSQFVSVLNESKIPELKSLARDVTHDLWPKDKEKHTFGSDLAQACALLPDSQNAPETQTKETHLRGRPRRASLMTRKEEKRNAEVPSKMFGSLLTSPVKTRAQLSPTTKPSPLFSPPARRAPNTVSTSTGLNRVSSLSGKRPSSVLTKPAAIDMERSSDFVIVEASQDPFETAKKRRTKATEHQLEVMDTHKDYIPKMFNTLDIESQQSFPGSLDSKSNSVSAKIEVDREKVDENDKSKKNSKRIYPLRRFAPMVTRASLSHSCNNAGDEKVPVPKEVIEESQCDIEKVTSSPLKSLEKENQSDSIIGSAMDVSPSSDFVKPEESGILQMDVTVASEEIASDDNDGENAMVMLAESIEAEAFESHTVDDSAGASSPDVVESSLETVAEVQEEGQAAMTTSPPNAVANAKVSPPRRDAASSGTTEAFQAAANESPLPTSTLAILKANRATPSSPGILKRPQSANVGNGTAILDTPSPARKPRHVSFSAKTYVKEISPINAGANCESVFMSWRAARRTTENTDHQQNSTPNGLTISAPVESSKQEISTPTISNALPLSLPSSKQDSSVEGVHETEPIYPSLTSCGRPIAEILPQIAPTVKFQHGLLAVLRGRRVKTIADIAKLSLDEVRQLPIRTPQVEVLKTALSDFEKKVGVQREGISRMAMMLGVRTTAMPTDVSTTPICTVEDSNKVDDMPDFKVESAVAAVSESFNNNVAIIVEQSQEEIVSSDKKMDIEDTEEMIGIRSIGTDMSGTEVDSDYKLFKSNDVACNGSSVGECQTDEYWLTMAAVIDQLAKASTQVKASEDFSIINREFISAYSRWCYRAVLP